MIGSVFSATGTIRELDNGWFRCTIVADSGNGGTTPRVRLRLGAGGENTSYTGDGSSGLFLWGLQFEVDSPFASSYMPAGAGLATRGADTFAGPFPHPPQEMTAYVKVLESGTHQTGGARLFQISQGDRFRVVGQTSDKYLVGYSNGIDGEVTRESALVSVLGEVGEIRALLHADGSVQIGIANADGVEALSALSPAPATGLAPSWSQEFLRPNSEDNGARGFQRFLAVKVQRGIRSMEFMRAL